MTATLVQGYREHDTNSLECWCKPRFFVPCDECDGDPACWKCGSGEFRGLIEIEHELAVCEDVTCVIVHNDAVATEAATP